MFISILGTWDSVSELLIVGDVRLTSFWTGILEPLPLVGDIRYFPAIKRGNWTSPTNRGFFFFFMGKSSTNGGFSNAVYCNVLFSGEKPI